MIDRLSGSRLEDNLNETICRYFQLGLTPEQALGTLKRTNDGRSADKALNDAAFRLGVYHAAKEAGVIDVDPDTLHAHGGDLEAARRWTQYQQRRATREVILNLMPGYREWLLEEREESGRLKRVRLEKYRIVCERIDRLVDLGRNTLEILHEIRRTEEYKVYEDEQKLAE